MDATGGTPMTTVSGAKNAQGEQGAATAAQSASVAHWTPDARTLGASPEVLWVFAACALESGQRETALAALAQAPEGLDPAQTLPAERWRAAAIRCLTAAWLAGDAEASLACARAIGRAGDGWAAKRCWLDALETASSIRPREARPRAAVAAFFANEDFSRQFGLWHEEARGKGLTKLLGSGVWPMLAAAQPELALDARKIQELLWEALRPHNGWREERRFSLSDSMPESPSPRELDEATWAELARRLVESGVVALTPLAATEPERALSAAHSALQTLESMPGAREPLLAALAGGQMEPFAGSTPASRADLALGLIQNEIWRSFEDESPQRDNAALRSWLSLARSWMGPEALGEALAKPRAQAPDRSLGSLRAWALAADPRGGPGSRWASEPIEEAAGRAVAAEARWARSLLKQLADGIDDCSSPKGARLAKRWLEIGTPRWEAMEIEEQLAGQEAPRRGAPRV
jgi:hypothetical protein